jgi:hypothetical protein
MLRWSVSPPTILQIRLLYSALHGFRRSRAGYHQCMKLIYVLAAILVCSAFGIVGKDRTLKTAMLVLIAVLSLYGLFRLIG